MQDLKHRCINHYLKNVWGEKDRTESSMAELEVRFKQKEQAIYLQNDKESVSAAQALVIREYQSINKKLKSGLYSNFP